MLTNFVKYGNICIVIALAIAEGYINLLFLMERRIMHVEGTSCVIQGY